MTISDKILKFRSIGLVRLLLILVLAIPAGFVFIALNDYSGRLKTEIVHSNKNKKPVGYHFFKCHLQLVQSLKNKRTFIFQSFEFERINFLHFKNQKANFLKAKDHLAKIQYLIVFIKNDDFEKLAVA